MAHKKRAATTFGATCKLSFVLCGAMCFSFPISLAFAKPPIDRQSQRVNSPLANPVPPNIVGYTNASKPKRMKARIQYDYELDSAERAKDANDLGGHSTLATDRRELDYDLYLRCLGQTIPNDFDPRWDKWSDRVLNDVNVLIERDLRVPGYAHLVVTVQPDGQCAAEFVDIMGGPIFKQQAHTLVEDLNTQRTLRFAEIADVSSISLKLGAGAFRANNPNNPKDGHFFCAVDDQLPSALWQLTTRYSNCHE